MCYLAWPLVLSLVRPVFLSWWPILSTLTTYISFDLSYLTGPLFISLTSNLVSTNINQTLYCLPHFVLAGSEKCGSGDFFVKLIQHQHVFGGKRKELQWFNQNPDNTVCVRHTWVHCVVFLVIYGCFMVSVAYTLGSHVLVQRRSPFPFKSTACSCNKFSSEWECLVEKSRDPVHYELVQNVGQMVSALQRSILYTVMIVAAAVFLFSVLVLTNYFRFTFCKVIILLD